MKLNLILASLVAVAVAQSSTGSEAAAPTATLSPEAKCAAKCKSPPHVSLVMMRNDRRSIS